MYFVQIFQHVIDMKIIKELFYMFFLITKSSKLSTLYSYSTPQFEC